MVSAIDIGCQTTARGSVLGRVFLYVSGYFFRRWPLPEQEGSNARGAALTRLHVHGLDQHALQKQVDVIGRFDEVPLQERG